MSEVIEKMEAEHLALTDHISSLSKDSTEYDQAMKNLETLTKSLVEAKQAEAERTRKEKERVQAIKQWQAEQKLKEDGADTAHAEFMIRLIVESGLRVAEDLTGIHIFNREMDFQSSDVHSFRWGPISQKLPFLGGKKK